MAGFRQVADRLRRTPLHPQWLLQSGFDTARWVGEAACGYVLDIGCMDRWVQARIRKECRYIGLDYPATGRDLYGAHPDVFADASKLPFANASIDTVVLLEVLEHLKHPAHALSEIARVLRPGGQLLLSMPFLYPIHDAPHDYQRYTQHGLRREIEACGLQMDYLQQSLGSVETGGLSVCLALGSTIQQSIAYRHLSLVLLPLLATGIFVTNIMCWLLGKASPNWPAMTAGYYLRAVRP